MRIAGLLFVLFFQLSATALASDSRSVSAPDGRRQIRAARATTPVQIDAQLDDEVWVRAEPTSEFIQSEPLTDQPATERTEVRLAYDDQNLYVAAHCVDSDPTALVVSEIRKDFNPEESDTFEVIIDTFGDKRNGFVFITNVEGAKADQQVSNEGREVNASWDAVWSVRTRRTDDGWIAEMAIPFRSLRFVQSAATPWGINFSRRVRRKNEVDFWSPIPREYDLRRVSLAGTIAELTPAPPGRNLRIKPYVLARTVRAAGGASYDRDAELGLDLKYGVTPALTLDAALNPDFAQVEADEQEVNLTQFSQFFPEKRDFFLENSGIFYVGDAQRMRINPNPTPDEDMLLFFSRRIGLTEEGQPIPLLGGARLTGRAAGVSLGIMSMQQRSSETTPASQYMVARVRRDLMRGSDVGAFFMTRQSTEKGSDYNRVFGVDGNLRTFGRLDWNTFFAKTATPGIRDGQYAARSSLSWEDPFFHGKFAALAIGEGFQSDLSFYKRTNVIKYNLDTGIRWRPAFLRKLNFREQHPHVNYMYYTDLNGRVIAKNMHHGYQYVFNSGMYGEIAVDPKFESIAAPLRLARDAPAIPPGDYSWLERRWRFLGDQSRMFFWTLQIFEGGLWTGTQKGVTATFGVRSGYRFRINTSIQRRNISLDLPQAKFATTLVTIRTNYSFSPNMYLDSLLQYNRNLDVFNANVRFNFIHRPLSDFFIVFNEQRFVEPGAAAPGRGIIVKFTRMMAF